jgi:zinc transport system substrate-binding protein
MRTILICAVLVLAAAGCGGDGPGGEGTTVAAGAYPLAFLAGEIAAAGVTVEDLTPPGVEPHDLELGPRDVARVREADVVFLLHGFQPAVEQAAEGAGGDVVNLLPTGSDGDPHLWLDPSEATVLAERMAEHMPVDRARVQVLLHRLEELDIQYEVGLGDCERHSIAVSHAAFGQLADRYGLEQIPLAGRTPGAEATPEDLARAARLVRERGITTIFVEPLVAPDEAETLARETGTKTAVLDPVESEPEGGNYFSAMQANLAALREALGCR